MVLDYEKIGKNIKIIREKYRMTQSEMAKYLKRTEDDIYSYESGRRKIPLDLLEMISRSSDIPINVIMYEDVEEYKKGNWGVFSSKMKFSDDVESLSIFSFYYISHMFPMMNTKKESNNFDMACEYLKKGLFSDEFSLEKGLERFKLSYIEDGIIEGAVNSLSVLGYIWMTNFKKMEGKERDLFVSLFHQELKSVFDINRYTESDEYIEFIQKQRKIFWDRYGDIIDTFLEVVRKNEKYYDYSYFYLIMQYYCGFWNPSFYKISLSEGNRIAIDMLGQLYMMKNKYAVDFCDFLAEIVEKKNS